MKKGLLVFVLAFSFLVPFSVIGAENVKESTINSDYVINSEMAPDTVKIKFYVDNQGLNLNDIKEKNDKIVNSAINEIKKKLNPDETIKTIAFRVSNIYSYKDKTRIFSKYEVTNGFEVKLKDLTKISDIINTAMTQGVKRVDNINFSIENGQAACNEYMAQAIMGAKQRAQYLAKALGTDLDKVKSVNPYCSLNSSYVAQPKYFNSSLKAMDSSGGAQTEEALETIEPGMMNIRASVNMIYYLK